MGDLEPDEVRSTARRAEEAGFDVFSSWDHVGTTWSALLPLLAAAEATERLRVCPLVLNNDLRHPVLLAAELADLDHLSGGRVELGIGAGHAFTEYDAIGVPFDDAPTRKRRMLEAVGVLRRLLDGETVTHDGEHYHLRGARTRRGRQAHLPVLIGVNGRSALAGAVPLADTIGLTMLGRTLPDGHRHEVRWRPEQIDAVVEHVRAQPGGDRIELNALVQAVQVTNDRRGAAEQIAERVEGLTLDDALSTPFLALGTHDEIAAHLAGCRRRWGISYFSVRAVDEVQPVIERLRALDDVGG